jgi:hypothetical protein
LNNTHKKLFPHIQDNESSMNERKMPTLRRLLVLIVLASSNGKNKSAPFLVGAFTTTSMPVSRFAIRTREHVLFSVRAKGRTILTPEKIDSFREGIEGLELPPPPFSFETFLADMALNLSRSLSFGKTLSGAGSFDAPSHDALSMGVPASDKTESLKKDLVVVASQINACTSSLTIEQRELVHSFLSIAQLAARRSSPDGGDAFGTAFWNVLLNSGWMQVDSTNFTTERLDMNATIDDCDQIVPILTEAFSSVTVRDGIHGFSQSGF